ncbi:hypothetical protein [Bryocella elongata]|nr:hypothetical protein [Bryocella elongata]
MSPPTAPPRSQPILPISTGLGPLQFQQVDYGVPAPQALTRQLQADDDRTRAAALSAIGAPAQYLQRGHIPTPRALQLEFAPMGQNDDQDAILTAELDQHIVSAILVPADGLWRRVGTVIFPTASADATMLPSTFLRVARSVLQKGRYRAIFTAATSTPSGDGAENQGFMRVINNKAVVVMSFVSELRTCDTGHGKGHGGCDLTLRWVQPDLSEPVGQHTMLVSGLGKLSPQEAASPLSHAREFELTRLRSFVCQPFVFNDASQHYEPSAQPASCNLPRDDSRGR